MEEILASIRRIIEDNENTRPDAAAGSEPPAGRDPATRDAPVREVPLGDASVIEVDSFRQELRATRPSEARAPEPASPRWSEERAVEVAPQVQRGPVQPRAAANGRHDEPAPKHEALRPSMPGRPVAVVAPAAAPAIISEQAGRKVAASFGELSDALASRGRQSLDEMAAEMLRPMLQDWLDNNLPTLVEKLVREEIERVARGA
jgi:cell pole-organizing protein PopZ